MINEDLFRIGDYDNLYAQNIAFMYKHMKRFQNLLIEQDDLLGCGNLAFMKAIKTYDPNTSKWLTYFSRLMTNEILMLRRKTQRHRTCISLETVTVAIDGNTDITLSD
ncbi:MAG: sigma factor [Niameybacter sp.]